MQYFKTACILFLLPVWQAIGAGKPPAGSGQTNSFVLYVAPNGNDGWSGRLAEPNRDGTDGPFQHFDRARSYVQTIDKTKLSNITVLFRGGLYQLPSTVYFTAADSGSENTEIVYENFPGETPIISGGMRVLNWTNSGGNTWKAALPPGTVPFENLYYNGARRLRPRVGGYLGAYFRVFKTVYVGKKEDNCPYPVTDPNDPHFGLFECFDRFQYDPNPSDNNNPYADPWQNLVPPPGNKCQPAVGDPSLWGDIEILIFEQFSTSKLHVSCVDTTSNTVYLTGPTAAPPPPHASEAGFIETNRYVVENVTNALAEPGQWYLDRSKLTLTYLAEKGEDPNRDEVIVPQVPQLLVASGLHYVMFRGLTFEHDNYVVPFPLGHVSTELEPDIGAAVSFQNSDHITFDFGTLRQIAGAGLDFISCITDPSGGTDRSATPVPECVSTAPTPVITHNVVTNSALYDIGALGLRIGDPYLSTNNDDNVPHWTTVQNNVVEGYGRIIPASFGIGQGYGHDNFYIHNDVYDGYHCAISLSENAGDTNKPNGIGVANNTISFNHVYNLLQGIMNDGGSIRVDAGNAAYTAPGNKVWNNKIHDVTDASIMDSNGYGGHGIYMDNQTGLVDVENNLVYRVSDATVYTPHGPSPKAPNYPKQPNIINNNILTYGRIGMVEEGNPYQYPVPTAPDEVAQSFVITNNLFFFDRNLASTSPFRGVPTPTPFNVNTGCAYTPFAYSLYQEWDSNLYWRTDGAFATYADGFNVQTTVDNKGKNPPCAASRIADQKYYAFYDFSGWQTQVGEDQHGKVKNPYFAYPAYPFDDYRLLAGPPIRGFVEFDPNQAGRIFPFFYPPPVAPTFITANFSPWTDF